MDLLGPKEVPADAYYGVHTVRAMENFRISGTTVSDVPEMVRGMVMVKKASALANRELRTIQRDVADAIVAACDAILRDGRCLDQFPVDVFQGGAGTSVNMNTNEVVANLALELAGFEKGRYDVINPERPRQPLAVDERRLPHGVPARGPRARRAAPARAAAERAFDEKASEFADVLKMGRTQLQDAVPMSLGQEFAGFAVNVGEEIRRLEVAGELLLESTSARPRSAPGSTPRPATRRSRRAGSPR